MVDVSKFRPSAGRFSIRVYQGDPETHVLNLAEVSSG